jgi:hypothetical protein
MDGDVPQRQDLLIYRHDGSPGRRMEAHRAPASPLIGFTPAVTLYTMVLATPACVSPARDGSECDG